MSSANEQQALQMLEHAAQKINQSLVTQNRDAVSKITLRKMLRIVDRHGKDGIQQVQMLPNWAEGNTPHDLPSGYRMIFDASRARVVPAVYPVDNMYAGTMAVRIPNSMLGGSESPLGSDGLNVHQSEIVQRINDHCSVDNSMQDAYTGIFEHKQRGDMDYMHTYWAVTRFVQPSINEPLRAEIAAHADQSLSSLLNDSGEMRDSLFNAQRVARAEKVSCLLNAVGVQLAAQDILENRDAFIDNVCFSLVDDEDNDDESGATRSAGASASLYSDAVRVQNTTRAGFVLNENMRLGPVILRGEPNAVLSADVLDVMPSTTGLDVPQWYEATEAGRSARRALPSSMTERTMQMKMSMNNPCVWSGAAEYHPLLSKQAFRARTSGFKMMEQRAGFLLNKSINLTPVAVKIASPIV